MKITIIHKTRKLLHSKTIKNGGAFALYSFLNKGISFFIMMILASFISPEDYGQLSLYNTYVMFLGYFIGLSSSGYVNVSYFKNSKENFAKDFSAILLISAVVSSFILILLCIFDGVLSSLFQIPIPFLFIGMVASFGSILVSMNLDYFRIQEKVSIYGVLCCSFAVLNFLLTAYFVLHRDCNWKGRVYSQLICEALFSFIALIVFKNNDLLCFSILFERVKRILSWSIPLIPHSISIWLKQGMDRYIINESYDLAEVGLFSFALNLVSILLMVGTAFNQTNSVSLYQTLSSSSLTNDKKLSNLIKKEKYFTVLYVVVALFVFLCCSLLTPVFMPKYVGAIPYFSILIFGGLLQCIYLIHCNYLFYYGHTRQLMYITFGSAVLHLGLSLLVTQYSLYLTCCIYVFSQLIVTYLVVSISNKIKNNYLSDNLL